MDSVWTDSSDAFLLLGDGVLCSTQEKLLRQVRNLLLKFGTLV